MTKRDRTVLMIVGAVALMAAYWFLLLSPRRDEATKIKADLDAAQQSLTAAQSGLAASQQAKAAYSANYTSVARLGKAVPTDDDVDTLVFQLDSAAKASKSDFRKISLNAQGVKAAAPPAAEAAAATAGATGASGPTGAAAVAAPGATGAAGMLPAVAAVQSQTAGLPPGASVGPAGLLTMPFTFQFTGTFFNLASFLDRVEHFTIPTKLGRLDSTGRLITVDGIAMTGFPSSTVNVAANTFLLPPDQGLFDGATPSAPAQSATQAVSAGGPAAASAAPAGAAVVAGVSG